MGRPEQFTEVKPEGPACNQTALREGQGKVWPLGPHVVFFQPGRQGTQAEGQGEEGQGR